jgi:hypothetical protein
MQAAANIVGQGQRFRLAENLNRLFRRVHQQMAILAFVDVMFDGFLQIHIEISIEIVG